MISVTLLGKHGERIYINPHQIEMVTERPDTTIGMVSGKKYVVSDSVKDIYIRIVKYRRQLGINGQEE